MERRFTVGFVATIRACPSWLSASASASASSCRMGPGQKGDGGRALGRDEHGHGQS